MTSYFKIMNRRNPTRIELKLDDLEEYETAKREAEESIRAKDVAVNTDHSGEGSTTSTTTTTSSGSKTPRQTTPDRMGLRLVPRS